MRKFLITHRNTKNDFFRVGWRDYPESAIKSDIEKGDEYYVPNPTSGELIPVTVVDGHLKSVISFAADFIENLPLI